MPTIGARGIEFESAEALWTWCVKTSKSSLVPKAYIGKPEDIMVAVQMGMEIGLKPMTALQNIGVINGSPSVYGPIIVALVRNSPFFCEQSFMETVGGKGDEVTASVTMRRKPDGKPLTKSFSVEDAKRAGLWGKDVWKKYPTDMLTWRARHRVITALFADVTHGLAIHAPGEKGIAIEEAAPEIAASLDAIADKLELEYVDEDTGEVMEREPGEEG